MLIVGITGILGAGKGTIVNFLVNKYGFKHFSVREFLIKEIEKRGLEVNRDSMVIVANDLRAKFGPGYIVTRLYEQAAESGKDTIIESIRTLGEIDVLKLKGDFVMFAVDADPQIRYDRIVARASETDRISFADFVMNEQREMNSDDPGKQNVAGCIERADYVFTNNGNKEELEEQVEIVMKELGK